MKKILSAILAAALLPILFSACGTKQNTHILYFKDSSKSSTAAATFFNSETGESESVEMKRIEEDEDAATFSCEGDCSLYNMAYITFDGQQTDDFAFNACVSGWYKTEDDLLPYTQGEQIDYTAETDDIKLTGYGYEKTVHIWKPDDYDAASVEKYSTIYALDGQGTVYFGREDQKLKGCPVISEQVRAMTSETGEKAIIVMIENVVARDCELVSKIGTSFDEKIFGSQEYESMDGSQFADFIAETLVPYIRESYNVYTDALHTSITGCSLGGLESFYIAMEYPEVFGTVGGFSPSFWEYDDETWRSYLNEKIFDQNSPFLYFFTGPEGQDTGLEVTQMYDRLKELGYPEEKTALHIDAHCVHDSVSWRNAFSEFLTAMIFQRVDVLQRRR